MDGERRQSQYVCLLRTQSGGEQHREGENQREREIEIEIEREREKEKGVVVRGGR